MKILKQSAQIFNYLCQASSELNCILSIPILLTLTLRLVSSTSSSYFLIYSIIQSNEFLKIMTSFMPIMILLDWTLILVILSAADMPIYQVILNTEILPSFSVIKSLFLFMNFYYRTSCVYCASDYFFCRTLDFPKLCRKNLRSVLIKFIKNDWKARSILYLGLVLLVDDIPEANSRKSRAPVCCRTLYGWQAPDSFCKLISFFSINSESW